MQENVQTLSDGSAIDALSVSFVVPPKPSANSPNLPLLSLSPHFLDTGGSLPAGGSYYYAVTALDSNGNEGALSFTVPALIPGITNTNCVVIQKLSFPVSASSFNVYRGLPRTLYRIASAQTIGPVFIDSGLAPQPIGPPDAVLITQISIIGISTLVRSPRRSFGRHHRLGQPRRDDAGVYAGKAVRIMEGKGPWAGTIYFFE